MRMSNYTLKKGAHAYNVHLVYKKQSNQKQNLKQQVKKFKTNADKQLIASLRISLIKLSQRVKEYFRIGEVFGHVKFLLRSTQRSHRKTYHIIKFDSELNYVRSCRYVLKLYRNSN